MKNNFTNELTFLFLKAQEHLGLPQPNLSVRLNKKTSDALLKESIKVASKGSGMPQFFNDEAHHMLDVLGKDTFINSLRSISK